MPSLLEQVGSVDEEAHRATEYWADEENLATNNQLSSALKKKDTEYEYFDE